MGIRGRDFQNGGGEAPPPPLYFGSTRLPSERGVQQGDPLGPALFAAAIHPLIEDLQGHLEGLGQTRLDLNAFYLDDGVLALSLITI